MGLLDQWNKADNSIKDTLKQAMDENHHVLIKYRKFEGDVSERTLSNIQFNNSFEEDGFHNDHIKAYCHLREEERTFKIDRIISITILNSI